jgi:hypothetical protein
MLAALDEPLMQGFVGQLDAVNAIADASAGFVWRYETPEGDTTEAEVFGDELVLFNMSVWESIEALEEFAYKSPHVAAVRNRGEWFARPSRSPLVLWWINAGHRPTVQEAKTRLDLLWADGPTPAAFTFRRRFSSN